MDLRIFTEPQQGATYDDLLRVARATEECGFDACFRSDLADLDHLELTAAEVAPQLG